MDEPRTYAPALVVGGLVVSAGMCLLSARGVEPLAIWLYPAAWYPLLLAIEGGIALRHGRFLLLGRPRLLLSVVGWSVPLWMLWEVLNFRLENWYYVFVPDRRAELWTGVVLSFGTVLPACLLPAALVWPRSGEEARSGEGARFGEGARSGQNPTNHGTGIGESLPRGRLTAIRLAGVAMLVLPLVWPRVFFPIVWGGFVFLVEPDLYRHAPSRSLLADVVRGRLRRIGALLLGGALAGLTWEALNSVARGRWIYTVPFLEELKLFEMPLLGFLGFPPLALSCFSLYQWLCLRGWAVPLRLDPTTPPQDTAAESPAPEETARAGRSTGRFMASARLGAALFVILTLLGMEEWTIASRTPRLRDLPVLLPSDVETLRVWGVDSPFILARSRPADLIAQVPGVSPDEAEEWIHAARLATTRGIGTRNARILHGWGIRSVDDLARIDPSALADCFGSNENDVDVRPTEVRVWWRAARDKTGWDGEVTREPGC